MGLRVVNVIDEEIARAKRGIEATQGQCHQQADFWSYSDQLKMLKRIKAKLRKHKLIL